MSENSHQLAAILFADVVGYTAMMQQDENAAVEKINRFRQSIETITAELNGKIIQYYGDGSLLLFNSATDAAEFAKILQTELNTTPVVPVRIGIHMGDVLLQGGNVFGDVVNIAARIQALAPAGGIYISDTVFTNITNKKGLDSVFVKEHILKNVKDPVRIYEILTEFRKTVPPSPSAIKPAVKPIAENSIAVLPFSNMSSDKEQEYFSDGLTEDIITQLSKIKSLKVISRTSVMQYKKNNKPIKEIGNELGVAVILEGSVQRYGDNVRITAQLINAASDDHLWAESFDRPVKDLFSIQREVAMSIASVLNTKLSKKETQNLDNTPTVDLQAYDLYLRGKFLVEKRNKTDLLIARELFHQALNKDKGFAIAYSGLADTYLLSSYRGYEDPDIMLPLAKKNADIALSLDSSSGEIQATLGYWYHQSFNWKEAEKTYRKAIELNPNQSNVYLWLAILLEAKEEKEEALRIYDKGSEVNPVWDYLMQNKIRALANNNNETEAIRLQKQLIEKAAYDPVIQKSRYINLSKLYWFFGNKEEAIVAAEKAQSSGLTRFYRTGDYKLLEKEVDEHYRVLRKSGEYISELWMGVDYAMAGAKEKALESFNNAIVLENTAITLLLIRQYEFLNLKYLDLVRVTRKIKLLINF
ncbi:MAG TPA: tetratricopeptide repeat protein [Chitinophagaceae bacterium]|nr:tetratricopeptide repeat protein [Chitinophagaceae bacterium]